MIGSKYFLGVVSGLGNGWVWVNEKQMKSRLVFIGRNYLYIDW